MNDKEIIDILESANDFVSGEYISDKLNVSRTSVWKVINKLRLRGCKIISSTNKGYMLIGDSDIISNAELEKTCKTKVIGRKIVYRDKCSSTNDLARQGELDNDDEGSVYITDYQINGRGRMGRNWHFEENRAIAMSILLKPILTPVHMMPISLIAGLAVCNAIKNETGIDCRLKWPNDVVVNSKKIAGILIESSIEGEYTKYVVLGIGINCNMEAFPDELDKIATSILIETGKKISRKSLICSILNEFEELYFEWTDEYDETFDYESENYEFSYLKKYKEKCINLGKNVIINKNGNKVQGIVKDITLFGNLLLEVENEDVITISSGEVSLRSENGYA